jgi:transcriptional regulator with XRE-family HTH domain
MTNSPGTRIKYLRQISSMSQEELGRRVGVQRAAINKYEKGTVENIPIKTIEQIAKVFDVSPTFIVGWNDHSGDSLAVETKVLQGVHHFYGKEAVELLESFTELSQTGKERLITYAEELTMIYK